MKKQEKEECKKKKKRKYEHLHSKIYFTFIYAFLWSGRCGCYCEHVEVKRQVSFYHVEPVDQSNIVRLGNNSLPPEQSPWLKKE